MTIYNGLKLAAEGIPIPEIEEPMQFEQRAGEILVEQCGEAGLYEQVFMEMDAAKNACEDKPQTYKQQAKEELEEELMNEIIMEKSLMTFDDTVIIGTPKNPDPVADEAELEFYGDSVGAENVEISTDVLDSEYIVPEEIDSE